MKTISLLFALLFSTGLFAITVFDVANDNYYNFDMTVEQCTYKCRLISTNMTAFEHDYCSQIFMCRDMSWDKQTKICTDKGEESKTYYMSCRDIGPVRI